MLTLFKQSSTKQQVAVTAASSITAALLLFATAYLLIYVARRCEADITAPNSEALNGLANSVSTDSSAFVQYFNQTYQYLQLHPSQCPTTYQLYQRLCESAAETQETLCQQATAISKSMYDEAALQMDRSTDLCDQQVQTVAILCGVVAGFFGGYVTGKKIHTGFQQQQLNLLDGDGPINYNSI